VQGYPASLLTGARLRGGHTQQGRPAPRAHLARATCGGPESGHRAQGWRRDSRRPTRRAQRSHRTISGGSWRVHGL